jgi:hypothetical protein
MSFKSYLLNVGVVDTRAFALQCAVKSLHNAVACMDLSQRAILDEHCPELMAAANRFGQLEQGMAIFEGTQPVTQRTFDDRDPFSHAMQLVGNSANN